jgi:hypothetical protein
MREQGIAANATPRVARGRNKGKTRDAIFRAQQRDASSAVRERVTAVAKQLVQTGSLNDPARSKPLDTRTSVVGGWLQIADKLDLQGEITLAADVRYFARHLPPVLTDGEAIAVKFAQHLRPRQTGQTDQRTRGIERNR